MKTHDRIIQETNQKKNELETYIYEWRDRLDGKMKPYTVEANIPSYLESLSKAGNWLENEGESASKS